MTGVTTVCCGKAQPQPKAQGPSPTYLQRPCKENPSTRPPSDTAVRLQRQLPSPVLPHLRAHRKAQSSYFAVSLQRWVSSRGNEHQKCKEVHKKKEGKSKTQQSFAKCNTLQPNSHSAILCGWSWPFLHARGQHLFPDRCPSKTQGIGRACSTPNTTNPPKPRGWFKATRAFTNTHILTLPFWHFLPAGSDPNPSPRAGDASCNLSPGITKIFVSLSHTSLWQFLISLSQRHIKQFNICYSISADIRGILKSSDREQENNLLAFIRSWQNWATARVTEAHTA